MISNNTPETMTRQQRYHEKDREKRIEGGKRYYEENKKRIQNMARDQYRGLSEKGEYKKR